MTAAATTSFPPSLSASFPLCLPPSCFSLPGLAVTTGVRHIRPAAASCLTNKRNSRTHYNCINSDAFQRSSSFFLLNPLCIIRRESMNALSETVTTTCLGAVAEPELQGGTTELHHFSFSSTSCKNSSSFEILFTIFSTWQCSIF